MKPLDLIEDGGKLKQLMLPTRTAAAKENPATDLPNRVFRNLRRSPDVGSFFLMSRYLGHVCKPALKRTLSNLQTKAIPNAFDFVLVLPGTGRL